jgi:hypothetical protein
MSNRRPAAARDYTAEYLAATREWFAAPLASAAYGTAAAKRGRIVAAADRAGQRIDGDALDAQVARERRVAPAPLADLPMPFGC